MTLEEKWKWFEGHNKWGRVLFNRVGFNALYQTNSIAIVIDLDNKEVRPPSTPFGELKKWRLQECFKDFTHPTEKESLMFEMLYGVTLPWSEEHPLLFPDS